jgi:hypothetical protein
VFQNHIQFRQKHVDQDLQLLRDIQAELAKGTYPFDVRQWVESGPIHQIAGLAWKALATKGDEVPGVFLRPTIVEANVTEVRQAPENRLVLYATVTTKVEAGPWPARDLTEVALISIDLRIILDRTSLQPVEWDYGAELIDPLQPPAWFASWHD